MWGLTGNEIKIGRDGKWYNNGQEMFRLSIVNLFARNLHRDENGEYYIKLGEDTAPVVVEDCPFYVVGIDESQEKLTLVFHDRQEMEVTEPIELILEGDVPYISYRWPRDARLSRGVYWKLSNYFDLRDDGIYIVPPVKN